MTEVQDTMAFNTPVTLTIVSQGPNQNLNLRCPGHQLATIYNHIMQMLSVHFPEDEEWNQRGTERIQMQYMGLTHLRNSLIAPNRPSLNFLTTHSVDRNIETQYFLQVDLQEEEAEEEHDESDNEDVISIASSVSVRQEEEEEEEDIHTPSPIHR